MVNCIKCGRKLPIAAGLAICYNCRKGMTKPELLELVKKVKTEGRN